MEREREERERHGERKRDRERGERDGERERDGKRKRGEIEIEIGDRRLKEKCQGKMEVGSQKLLLYLLIFLCYNFRLFLWSSTFAN